MVNDNGRCDVQRYFPVNVSDGSNLVAACDVRRPSGSAFYLPLMRRSNVRNTRNTILTTTKPSSKARSPLKRQNVAARSK